jgi:hypothetical protein
MSGQRGTMNPAREKLTLSRSHPSRAESRRPSESLQFIVRHLFLIVLLPCLCVSAVERAVAQLETVDSIAPATISWVSQGQIEGHLALPYSPAGAFSPDNKQLAVVVENKVVLMDLGGGAPRSQRPRVEGVSDLVIHSASFLAPHQLLILAHGVLRGKGKNPPRGTPTLAFLWDTEKDVAAGKVSALGESGGYAPLRFFPMIGYIVHYKESNFDLWHPLTGKGGRISVPALTRQPNLYDLSPNGHWMILAQLEGGGGADPVVVDLRTGNLADSLSGQQSTTLSIAFSRDNQRVMTACEDGKIRLWSVGDWKLVATLAGHNGTVSWAEFSPDGRWIVSAGYDKTVRVWSAGDGSLIQTLTEANEPVRTVAFSPNGEFLAGSGEEMVWIWIVLRR